MAKVGRPTKYKPEMCGRVIELMREGCSIIEVAADLDVRRKTLWEWTKNNEEFSNAIKRGEELSQAWWEEKGRTNLGNKDFSTALWFINMKNRFRKDWRDKHEYEHSGPDGNPVTIQTIPKFKTPEAYIEWQKKEAALESKNNRPKLVPIK